MSAIKIGKYYLTKNNPRELLRLLAEEEDKIDEYKQENQELKDKIKIYEDPDDLTLMFMYCDEKAKDKIKELKKQLEEVDKKLFFTKNELEMRQKSIDNKLNQQKEFIEWLEDNWNTTQDIWYIKILNKYKEIIGVSNDSTK